MCPVCHLTYHEGEERCLVDGADLEEVEDERIGTVLGGRYVLEEVLGVLANVSRRLPDPAP